MYRRRPWPSKALDDVVNAAVAKAATEHGPTASASGGNQAGADAAINAQLDEVQKLLDPESATVIAQLKTLIPDIHESVSKQREFVDTLRKQLTSRETDNDEEPSSHKFLTGSAPAILADLSKETPGAAAGAPTAPTPASTKTPAAGMFGDIFGGIKGALIKFVNLFSYFEMKERAGTVGLERGREVAGPPRAKRRAHSLDRTLLRGSRGDRRREEFLHKSASQHVVTPGCLFSQWFSAGQRILPRCGREITDRRSHYYYAYV